MQRDPLNSGIHLLSKSVFGIMKIKRTYLFIFKGATHHLYKTISYIYLFYFEVIYEVS